MKGSNFITVDKAKKDIYAATLRLMADVLTAGNIFILKKVTQKGIDRIESIMNKTVLKHE